MTNLAALAAPTIDLALERYCQERNEAAFRALIDAHAPAVRAICRKVLHRPDLTEDATQETFVRLLNHADAIRGSAGPWLRATALNISLNHLRSEAARRRRERGFGEDCMVAAAAGCQAPIDAEVRLLISENIARLSDDHRSVISRIFFLEMTQEDVATEEGVTQVAIHKRLRRALTALRIQLVKSGIADALSAFVNPAAHAGMRAFVMFDPFSAAFFVAWNLPRLVTGACMAGSRAGVAAASVATVAA